MQLLAMALATAVNMAPANAPTMGSRPPEQAPPISVWRTEADGAVVHQQSGRSCPSKVGRYLRTDVVTFDIFGVDVGCGYRAGRTILTLYLTLRKRGDLATDLAEAKVQLLKAAREKHPDLVSESRSTDAGFDWTTVIYAEDRGVRSGIWLADLAGWTMKYRVTYADAEDAQVNEDLKAFSQVIRSTAGERLPLCAKATAPKRPGRPVSGRRDEQDAALTSSLVGGAAIMAAREDSKVGPAPALTWCVETGRMLRKQPLLFWRGINSDGTDAQADRISAVTHGPPPIMTVEPDALATLADGAADSPPRWIATMTDRDQTQIYGAFDGRPPPDLLAALFDRVLNGEVRPLGAYGVQGKDLTIALPASR